MTVIRVDPISGNNANDGSTWALAKQTINGLTSLTSSDEIRVAKSADPTALSGTTTWTDGSASVTTSADLTGVLAAGDLISKASDGSDGWWEISSLTSSTITLLGTYRGTSGSGVTGYKLGTTDFNATGSTTNPLGDWPTSRNCSKISGGWNTGSDTRDGWTHFRNTNATRQGRACKFDDSSFTGEVAYFGCWRCGTEPIRVYSINYLHHLQVGWGASGPCLYYVNCGTYEWHNFFFINHQGNIFQHRVLNGTLRLKDSSIIQAGGSGNGFDWNYSYDPVHLDNVTIRGGTSGTGLVLSNYSIVKNCTIKGFNYGVDLQNGGNRLSNCSIQSANTTDIKVSVSQMGTTCTNYLYNCLYSSITSLSTGNIYQEPIICSDDDKQVAGKFVKYMMLATIESDTTDARSGKCVKISPKRSATAYYLPILVRGLEVKVPISNGVTTTFSVYVKKDSSWNGTLCYLRFYRRGLIVDEEVITLTTSYVQYSVSYLGAADEAGEVTLEVNGSAGAVFADDYDYA